MTVLTKKRTSGEVTAVSMSTATATGKRSTFFTDPGMNSTARAMLGRMYTGAADAGEALTTIDRITDGDYVSWAREWEATADRIAAIGDDCLRRGRRVSGRNALLRAATYYTACVVVVDGLDEPETVLARTFAAYRRRWEQYLGLLDNPPERLDIPYEGTTMPGWFFAVGGDGPKPTLVVANGADGALSCGPATAPRRRRVATTSCCSTGPASSACCSSGVSRSGPTGSTSSGRSSTRCCAARTSTRGVAARFPGARADGDA
jgi:hypothetical protein